MGQNFNKSESSLKNIVRDQLRINLKVGKKLHANDRILQSIASKMNNFTVAVQNQQNFNKVLEMEIPQLVAALPHPNGGDFPGQLAVITRSGKIMAKPKAKSKKMSPTDPVKKEEKVEAKVEAEPEPKKEE
jgi:hypothetical protein